MPGLAELARDRTSLDHHGIEHLQRLVATWSLLSDLSFADLLIYAPTSAEADAFIVLGHTRSLTGPTVHVADPVGTEVRSTVRPLLRRALLDGSRCSGVVDVAGPTVLPSSDAPFVEEDLPLPALAGRLTVEYIPIRVDDEVVAVLARESEPGLLRHSTQLERTYRDVWERFAAMVEVGAFPVARSERVGELREPRVGDGVIILDREQRVDYASPNAMSALHRLGVVANVMGQVVGELGVDDRAVRRAYASRQSTVEELERGDAVAVIARCHPLVADGRVSGAVLLLRDISELRRRDRLLVSKDATIREIHHRVKNNLQTIQSLLRLQSRRLESTEAKAAVEQSARRIGAIAIVHETLSVEAADVVDFDAVIARVVQMVEEGLGSAERPIRVEVVGSLGELDGDVAMPLAVVLTELVQNAIDHAGLLSEPDVDERSTVTVELVARAKDVEMRVTDRGQGVPDGFALDRDARLGLTIVRTFVVHDLGGSIRLRRARTTAPFGTTVEVRVPRAGSPMPLG